MLHMPMIKTELNQFNSSSSNNRILSCCNQITSHMSLNLLPSVQMQIACLGFHLMDSGIFPTTCANSDTNVGSVSFSSSDSTGPCCDSSRLSEGFLGL